MISIHAPAKGATWLVQSGDAHIRISIHAPAKGATCLTEYNAKTGLISIHAPAKGATLRRLLRSRLTCYFNPRSREGSDYMHVNQHYAHC